MRIVVDDLRGEPIRALLEEHLASMHEHSPPQSVHALDLNALRQSEITFWTAWEGNTLLGCGALKHLDAQHAELKSMRTARNHLRQGVARAMLLHILAQARHRGYARISLETGSPEAFAPARALYTRNGFVTCGPFEGYFLDTYSVFMTLDLSQDAALC